MRNPRHVAQAAVTAALLAYGAIANAGIAYGVGALSCGSFLEIRKNDKSPARSVYVNWIAGYLTASSAALNFEALDGTDMDGAL